MDPAIRGASSCVIDAPGEVIGGRICLAKRFEII